MKTFVPLWYNFLVLVYSGKQFISVKFSVLESKTVLGINKVSMQFLTSTNTSLRFCLKLICVNELKIVFNILIYFNFFLKMAIKISCELYVN